MSSPGLTGNRDFLKLWAGQSVSLLGSTVSRDALPLTALLVFSATPGQMGTLAALSAVPAVLMGLPTGVLVDRLRRRPIMIASDLTHALLVASVPLLASLGALTLNYLYVVCLVSGALALLFEVSYQSYVPTLVGQEHLVEANSKLSASGSLAEVSGSAVAGALVQAVGGPGAMLLDAVSFLFSAAGVASISRPEPAPEPSAKPDFRREITEGISLVLRDPLLRPLAIALVIDRFCGYFFATLYGLFAIRTLGIAPALLGILIASGGAGSFLGAIAAPPMIRRYGLGMAIILGAALDSLLVAFVPLAQGSAFVAAGFLLLSQVFGDMAATVFGVAQVSTRQTIVAPHLLGRANGSVEFFSALAAPAGAMLSGFLAVQIGIRQTLFVAVAGKILASLLLFGSPLRHYRGT